MPSPMNWYARITRITGTTDINVVAVNWWLMLPVVPVILVILAYQFMGDGMRDAADPSA